MLTRDGTIQAIAALVLVLALASASALSPRMAAEAGRAQLVYTDQASEGDPPEVALGIAMGAFRGLFVNYLWIRANQLKEDGKFYEAIELSSAITRLQPRFPRVWAFHAWNMSYNISVATKTASERWTWVKAGVDLLRSQGIPRNPNDTLLHKELAWIFNHKIQGFSDDANHYYKRELAREWTEVLGTPPNTASMSREEATAAFEAFLMPIVEAPALVEALVDDELALHLERSDDSADDTAYEPRVLELVDRIREEARLELGMDLLRLLTVYDAQNNSWTGATLGVGSNNAQSNSSLDALIADERYALAWEVLVPFVRRSVLISEYHMEPSRMLRYTRDFGPLDWRHPSVHAVYWTTRGVEEGETRIETTGFTTLNTDRITLHAIQELFRFGDIQYDYASNEYFALPSFHYAGTYGEVLGILRARAQARDEVADDPNRAFRLYSAGYENFIREVIRIAFNRGDIATAERYHKQLREADWLNQNDERLLLELSELSLSEFVDKQLEERISIPHVAVSEIEAAITQAFLQGLLRNDSQFFANRLAYARKVYDSFRGEQDYRTVVDADSRRMLEYVGDTFAESVSRVLVRLLTGRQWRLNSMDDVQFGNASDVPDQAKAGGMIPEIAGQFAGGQSLGIGQSAMLFNRLPAELQLAVYDDLMRFMAGNFPQVTQEGRERYFPPPPGIEDYRQRLQTFEQSNAETWLPQMLQREQQ